MCEGKISSQDILCDQSKVIENVSHCVLLVKLKFYRILGIELDLFKFYLIARKQVIYVDVIYSKIECFKCGVPQSSVLAPILVLIFVNDFPYNKKSLYV